MEKRKEGKRFLTREMQYARTLERGKAILKEGFELIECWEQDFNEREGALRNAESRACRGTEPGLLSKA